jgi:hypothetical protein
MRSMTENRESPAVTGNPPSEYVDLAPGLKRLRRRRWYLWSTILIYLPLMWSTLGLSSSFQVRAAVFATWFCLLLTTALIAALARCPACGNYFHVHGMTFLCLRQCLHCQLHVCRDKKSSSVRGEE